MQREHAVVSVYNILWCCSLSKKLGAWGVCGIVDIDAARQAKADAALVLSMPVGCMAPVPGGSLLGMPFLLQLRRARPV
jgi:hypothetical protein